MKILITGATGFVGEKLVMALVGKNHKVSVLTRDPESTQKRLPIVYNIPRWEPELYTPSSQEFSNVDAVIHLAGSNIASGRWTTARKQFIHESRVLSTKILGFDIKVYEKPTTNFFIRICDRILWKQQAGRTLRRFTARKRFFSGCMQGLGT
jgi:hypothetical protein|tara:strand:- start:981 stop:1436 length:456 start_codon:yes stop_codon:yes gene_type:complete